VRGQKKKNKGGEGGNRVSRIPTSWAAKYGNGREETGTNAAVAVLDGGTNAGAGEGDRYCSKNWIASRGGKPVPKKGRTSSKSVSTKRDAHPHGQREGSARIWGYNSPIVGAVRRICQKKAGAPRRGAAC